MEIDQIQILYKNSNKYHTTPPKNHLNAPKFQISPNNKRQSQSPRDIKTMAAEIRRGEMPVPPAEAFVAVRRLVNAARMCRRRYFQLKDVEKQNISSHLYAIAFFYVLLGVWLVTSGLGPVHGLKLDMTSPQNCTNTYSQKSPEKSHCVIDRLSCIYLVVILVACIVLLAQINHHWQKLMATHLGIRQRIQERDELKLKYEAISQHYPAFDLDEGNQELADEFLLELAFGEVDNIWDYDVVIDLRWLGLGPGANQAGIGLPLALLEVGVFVIFMLFQTVWCFVKGCPLGRSIPAPV